MTRERADWSCPECGSSDVFRDGRHVWECRRCEHRTHESVADARDSLERLAERDDEIGDLANQLLETGGVQS